MRSEDASSLQAIHRLIQSARLAVAGARLRKILRREIPRAYLPTVASLCRRLGLSHTGLTRLGRYVSPRRRKGEQATVEETIEYAGCLVGIGAVHEALDLLATFGEVPSHPRAHLYRALAEAARSEFSASLVSLDSYLRRTSDPYDRSVGEAHVARVLVHARQHGRAQDLIGRLIPEAASRGYCLVQSRLCELLAVSHLLQRELGPVERLLDEAAQLLTEAPVSSSSGVRKWRAVLAALQEGGASARAGLEVVRREAGEAHDWETVRDCDRFLAIAEGNAGLAAHVYFGTPSAPFREALLLDLGGRVVLPSHYDWRSGSAAGDLPVVDLATGACSSGAELGEGSLLHRLLVTLCSDFYRPLRIAEIFSAVARGERYSETSGAHRIVVAAARLRTWMRENEIPIEIVSWRGSYRLQLTRGGSIRIPLPDRAHVPARREIRQLREKFQRAPFSVREAKECLRLSDRSLFRVLKEACLAGTLGKQGSSRSTRYFVPPSE